MSRLRIIAMGLMATLVVAAAWNVPSLSSESRLFGGVWLAEEVGGKPVPDKARLTISIAADGTVSGSGGCNRFTGTAVVEGNRISFPPFAATRKMCVPAVMIPEQEFLGALAAVTAYRLEGSSLMLYDQVGMQRVKLAREK